MAQEIELELLAMAHGGSALGRHDNRTVFIPYTIPGERVRARIVREKGRTVFAEGVTLLEASADRVYPRCAHFGPGKCGRCHWQHIDYAAQLLLKQDVLADQLERVGGLTDVEVRPLIGCPEPWGYNQQMTLIVTEGGLVYGGSGRSYPIDECWIARPELMELKQSLNLEQIAGLQQITFQMDDAGASMLILRTADDLAPELEADLPVSVNLLLTDNQAVNLIGDLHGSHEINGRTFRVSAGSFFRPNGGMLPALVGAVLAGAAGSGPVLDLYGGVGVFSAFVAQEGRPVTLVESYPPAAADAEINLAELSSATVVEGSVEGALEQAADIETVIADPPGDGLTLGALDGLKRLGADCIVYVSSDPATLARDGQRLTASGYRLEYVQPIDLSPQTYYIDTVAVFRR